MMRLLPLVTLLLIGCAHTYEMHSQEGGAPSLRVARDASFYVAVPEDGRFEEQLYTGSGRMTADAVRDAFAGYSSSVRVGEEPAPREENLVSARAIHSDYLVQPTIVHWEDRATEWSGRPDRISIRVEMIEVSTDETRDSTMLSGKSRWFTFGGDHPRDLLPEALAMYVRAIFAQ